MAEFPNPPILTAAPTDGQTCVYQASSNTWVPAAITAATVTVPQPHEANTAGPVAQTGATVSTANAATQTGSYVQADVQTIAALANALKTDYNKTITDVANLITEHGALVTAHNALVSALQTAGILAAS